MGTPFSYNVSFRVKHPTLDAATIAARLRRTPTFCWTVGEPHKTPKGTALEGIRKESYCTFDVADGSDGALASCLDTALADLEPFGAFLREVRTAGGSLMFYAFWYPNGDTGEVFSPDLLRRMADLEIELGINVYDDRPQDG